MSGDATLFIWLGDRQHGMHFGPAGTQCGRECIESWKRGEEYTLDTKRCQHVRLGINDAAVIDLFYALMERNEREGQSVKTLAVLAEPLTRLATACKEFEEIEKQRKEESRAARRAGLRVSHG